MPTDRRTRSGGAASGEPAALDVQLAAATVGEQHDDDVVPAQPAGHLQLASTLRLR